MPLSYYLYVPVLVGATSEALVIGISSTPEKHVIVDSLSTVINAALILKAYYEREEIMAFPTSLFTLQKTEADMGLDIPEGGILYVGFKNTSGAPITQDIMIKYHYKE